MKKRLLILILLTTPSFFLSMDKSSQKKIFPFSVKALDELTNKNIGCSEDLTDRSVKYTAKKDQEIQNKIKNGLPNSQGKGVASFLETMHKKYHNSEKPLWLSSIDPECKAFPTECNDVCDFTPDGKYKIAPNF